MKTDWILVANASRARLLQHDAGMPLVMLQHFDHPQSRLHAADLAPDQMGRRAADRAHGAVAMTARNDPHRRQAELFAQELTTFIEQAARERRFHRLNVFAAPPFLSLLRRHCGPATQRLLGGMFNVDLSAVDTAALGPRIARELAQRRPLRVPPAPPPVAPPQG